ncbi:Uncharacterised protein [Serratia proteamaculans]|uniref:Uncharacterized protein n=1 Tax=Serratia proteamaculans TaxID=28151 RepID=A0ABS0TNB3_SERPR|nr:hypothetical protein [Serratia proteamaculans]MBI6179844.1 hypothetical protein [Serratia proteamaculans]RYM53343.1 hypothetical protein BSQ97_10255 [Serratia proteamaculans]CAI2481589.1 Uncharacterised protein [Serratia proteamaculans]
MTDHVSESVLYDHLALFGLEPELATEDTLRDEVNRAMAILAPHFKTGQSYKEVDDLKNHRNSVRSLLGPEIARVQYLNHKNTQSDRRLVLLMAPLNVLAKKWRKSYVLKDDPAYYSLSYYDFHDDRQHYSAVASEMFETYIANHGNFMRLAQETAGAIESMVVEILRMKPRVDNDFDAPDATYLTGLSDTFQFLDRMIDAVLEKYTVNTHSAADEENTLAFYKHVCKNAGLHVLINEGMYFIKESEEFESSVSAYLHWHKDQESFSSPKAGSEEMMIATCIAVIHALERSAGGNWRAQLERNMNPKYLGRVADFVRYVRYVRYAKNEENSPLSLQLLRRGGTSKGLAIYSALIDMSNLIYRKDFNELASRAIAVLDERKLHGELRKYVGNIFSVMSCWEGFESDISAQMSGYCVSRKLSWTYRTGFIRKLLRLDYVQLQQFHQDIVPVMYDECARLESALNLKLMR